MGLINIQMTNFENGVNNRNAADLFGSMGQLDPTKFHTFMEDFNYYVAANWTIGGAGAGTVALNNSLGGQLRLTTAGADDDAEFLIKVGECFAPTASQPLYFRSKQSVDAASDSDLVAGLADTIGLTPANGIIFRKDDDDTALSIIIRSGSADVAIETDIADIGTSQFTCEFYWDGIDRVYYGVNDTPLGFLDASTLPVGILAPSFGVQAGAVAALVGDFDYIFAAAERG